MPVLHALAQDPANFLTAAPAAHQAAVSRDLPTGAATTLTPPFRCKYTLNGSTITSTYSRRSCGGGAMEVNDAPTRHPFQLKPLAPQTPCTKNRSIYQALTSAGSWVLVSAGMRRGVRHHHTTCQTQMGLFLAFSPTPMISTCLRMHVLANPTSFFSPS